MYRSGVIATLVGLGVLSGLAMAGQRPHQAISRDILMSHLGISQKTRSSKFPLRVRQAMVGVTTAVRNPVAPTWLPKGSQTFKPTVIGDAATPSYSVRVVSHAKTLATFGAVQYKSLAEAARAIHSNLYGTSASNPRAHAIRLAGTMKTVTQRTLKNGPNASSWVADLSWHDSRWLVTVLDQGRQTIPRLQANAVAEAVAGFMNKAPRAHGTILVTYDNNSTAEVSVNFDLKAADYFINVYSTVDHPLTVALNMTASMKPYQPGHHS